MENVNATLSEVKELRWCVRANNLVIAAFLSTHDALIYRNERLEKFPNIKYEVVRAGFNHV